MFRVCKPEAHSFTLEFVLRTAGAVGPAFAHSSQVQGWRVLPSLGRGGQLAQRGRAQYVPTTSTLATAPKPTILSTFCRILAASSGWGTVCTAGRCQQPPACSSKGNNAQQ